MMTTNGMSCELFNDRLMAYLEHETDDPTRVAMERHAVTCGDCGPLLADLRKLRIDAANLPDPEPSRDLWKDIAARIEAPVVAIGTTRQLWDLRSGRGRRWMNGAMMVASLVAAAGIGYIYAGARGSGAVAPIVSARSDTPVVASLTDTQPAATGAPMESAPAGGGVRAVATKAPAGAAPVTAAAAPITRAVEVQLAIATLTADYDREIARLRALVEQRRNQLDPATVAVIERNLMVIDTAIAESKQAIARDPASRFLIESLNQSLQAKVELMRTAAVLPSRT